MLNRPLFPFADWLRVHRRATWLDSLRVASDLPPSGFVAQRVRAHSRARTRSDSSETPEDGGDSTGRFKRVSITLQSKLRTQPTAWELLCHRVLWFAHESWSWPRFVIGRILGRWSVCGVRSGWLCARARALSVVYFNVAVRGSESSRLKCFCCSFAVRGAEASIHIFTTLDCPCVLYSLHLDVCMCGFLCVYWLY